MITVAIFIQNTLSIAMVDKCNFNYTEIDFVLRNFNE